MPDLKSLRLLDYSDKELIAIVNDVAEQDGWSWTSTIAKTVGIKGERKNQNVGARLAWLKRYGIVEAHPSRRRWRVTPVGETFLNGRLTKTAETQLEKMEPGQLFMVTRWLGNRQSAASAPVGHMLRREWKHTTGR